MMNNNTTVIAMRLQKLDGYVQHLRQLQTGLLDEYLDDGIPVR